MHKHLEIPLELKSPLNYTCFVVGLNLGNVRDPDKPYSIFYAMSLLMPILKDSDNTRTIILFEESDEEVGGFYGRRRPT